MLHYDLSFLEKGNKWLPVDDQTRIENYKFSRAEFELTEEDAIRQVLPKGLLDLKKYDDFINCSRLLAYPRLLTLKTVDMVIGRSPLITAEKSDEVTQEIKDIALYSNLQPEFKKALIDYSRFGVFLLRIFKDNKGKAQITTWDPLEWVPVFYDDGTRRIKYNVIGWISNKILHVQIHSTENGSYEERDLALDDDGVIKEIISSRFYNLDSGKCLLYAITNTPTSTNPLGTNDYAIINGLLQKAIERLTAILRVLDEHADPSMTGPASLLEKDSDGAMVFKTGKYYAVNQDEMKPEYLVWDANLESSFKAFELLCEQIFTLSEMGEAFLGVTKGVGNVVSGTAMRFKMISPLEKARRITNDLTKPFKEIISAMLSINGTDIDPKDINITWRDSLPKDPKEVAELAEFESGSNAIKPLINAIMDNYDLDLATATKYVENIAKEQEKLRNNGLDKHEHPKKKESPMDPATSENPHGADNKRV